MADFSVSRVMCQQTAVSLVLAGAFLSFGVAQDISSDARQQIEQRVNLQKNWGETMSSPGAQLIAQEAERGQSGGRLMVRYGLHAKGLPQDAKYELILFPITAASADDLQTSGEVFLDESGRVMDAPGDPRSMIVADPAPGEPFRMALISKDQQHRAFVSAVPQAIEGSHQGCRIAIVRLTPKFELALVQVTGLPANAEVEFQSDSSGEVQNGKLRANAVGYVDTAILPFVKGKSDGKTKVKIVAPKCHPEATFHWGVTHE